MSYNTAQTWSKFECYVWWGLQMFEDIAGVRDMWIWIWVVELVVERFKFHMMSLFEDYGHKKCEFEGYLSKDAVHEEWLCKFVFL